MWIVEVGDASKYESFAAFQQALRTTRVDVQRSGSDPVQHQVAFVSPGQGLMEFTVAHGSPARSR